MSETKAVNTLADQYVLISTGFTAVSIKSKFNIGFWVYNGPSQPTPDEVDVIYIPDGFFSAGGLTGNIYIKTHKDCVVQTFKS